MFKKSDCALYCIEDLVYIRTSSLCADAALAVLFRMDDQDFRAPLAPPSRILLMRKCVYIIYTKMRRSDNRVRGGGVKCTERGMLILVVALCVHIINNR